MFNGAEAVRFWFPDMKEYEWYAVEQGQSIGIFEWALKSLMDKYVFSNCALSPNTTISSSLGLKLTEKRLLLVCGSSAAIRCICGSNCCFWKSYGQNHSFYHRDLKPP